jgi:hypothetical protein
MSDLLCTNITRSPDKYGRTACMTRCVDCPRWASSRSAVAERAARSLDGVRSVYVATRAARLVVSLKAGRLGAEAAQDLGSPGRSVRSGDVFSTH